MGNSEEREPEDFFLSREQAAHEIPLMEEDMRETMLDFINAINRYRRMFTKHYPREITQGEFMVLHAIERERQEVCGKEGPDAGKKKGIRMTELTRMLGSSKSALSKSIRILVEKGYVERWSDSKDKRNIYICLSPEGKRIFEECHKDMREFVLQILERMGKDDMREFVRLLNRFYDVIQEERKLRKEHMTTEENPDGRCQRDRGREESD